MANDDPWAELLKAEEEEKFQPVVTCVGRDRGIKDVCECVGGKVWPRLEELGRQQLRSCVAIWWDPKAGVDEMCSALHECLSGDVFFWKRVGCPTRSEWLAAAAGGQRQLDASLV